MELSLEPQLVCEWVIATVLMMAKLMDLVMGDM